MVSPEFSCPQNSQNCCPQNCPELRKEGDKVNVLPNHDVFYRSLGYHLGGNSPRLSFQVLLMHAFHCCFKYQSQSLPASQQISRDRNIWIFDKLPGAKEHMA